MKLSLMFLLPLLATCAQAAAAPGIMQDVDMKVTQERKNMPLRFERGAVGAMATDELLDGVVGYSADFGGAAVQVFIVFDGSVAEAQLFPFAEYQGRLHGSVQCKRVRLGTGRRFPDQSAIVAEQCVLKSISR